MVMMMMAFLLTSVSGFLVNLVVTSGFLVKLVDPTSVYHDSPQELVDNLRFDEFLSLKIMTMKHVIQLKLIKSNLRIAGCFLRFIVLDDKYVHFFVLTSSSEVRQDDWKGVGHISFGG